MKLFDSNMFNATEQIAIVICGIIMVGFMILAAFGVI